MPLPTTTTSFTNTEHLLTMPPMTIIRPTWFSAHSQALVALKEVDRVHVVPSINTSGSRTRDAYVVETYRSPASKNRIPINQQQTNEEQLVDVQQDQPARCTTKSYDDFVELRKKIYHHVHDAHESQLCLFCDEVMGELIGGNATPNVVTKLLIGDARVTQRLAKFLNCVLKLSKSCGGGERACLGQNAVPILLHDFITGQELAA